MKGHARCHKADLVLAGQRDQWVALGWQSITEWVVEGLVWVKACQDLGDLACHSSVLKDRVEDLACHHKAWVVVA